jgi:hypothetical protein
VLPVTSQSGGWTRRRTVAAAVAALAIAMVAFIYRFNTLDGSLGGFTNDQFADLMRSEMLLRGEQPLRDFADAELRGAWPALSYAAPAWAQQIFGRTLLADAYLTIGALAAAYAIVFVLALDLGRRWTVALLATALAIVMEPRLYSYQKLLMIAAGAASARALMVNPSVPRLAVAALVTAIATLFRHDGGVYVGAAVAIGIVARDAHDWTAAARRFGIYAGMTGLLLLPSALWVHVYEGIPRYLAASLRTAQIEAARTELQVSSLSSVAPFSPDGLVILTYYGFWAVAAVAVVIVCWRTVAGPPFTPAERGTAAALLALTLLSNKFLLRDSLTARFGDAIVATVLLAAWSAGAAALVSPASVRRTATAAPVVLLAGMFSTTWVFAEVGRTIDSAGLVKPPRVIASRFAGVRENLLRQPPDDWTGFDTDGTLVAARYLAQCTAPDDYVLVAAEASEIPVYARRRFAAGQGTVALGLYASDDEQERAVARFASQSVPIVLVNHERRDVDFSRPYPKLARYLETHYVEAGHLDAGMKFVVLVDADRTPTRRDPHHGLPCFR